MRVAVVTPVRNAESLISETITSILNQPAVLSGRVELTYIIKDGDSSDETVAAAERASAGRATVLSDPDSGMYDALARGFAAIEESGGADWYCYLNAGDLWHPRCLDVLASVSEHTTAQWVCGLHAYFAADGTLVHTKLPYRYLQGLLTAGAYGRGLPTVQQESTFWNRSLHNTIDMQRLATFKAAGDYFLWHTFAKASEPSIIQALMGGFRYHGGHLGNNHEVYGQEMESIAGALPISARLQIPAQLAIWEQPTRVKARMNPHLFAHSTQTGGWVSRDGSIPAQS